MKNRLGELVRAARGDISLRDYAKQIGISHSYLSSIESGINPANGKPISIGLETLEKLSKVTGYSVAYLTGDSEEEKPAGQEADGPGDAVIIHRGGRTTRRVLTDEQWKLIEGLFNLQNTGSEREDDEW